MMCIPSIDLTLKQYQSAIMHSIKKGKLKQARKLANIMESLVPIHLGDQDAVLP